MWGDPAVVLAVVTTSLLSSVPPCICHSAPGRPRISRCRSPEKETFTCWWEAGSDGGLPTTHRLYYRKERSEKIFECPDYEREGIHSCYFDKAHTSIWVIYNITVEASNAYGSTFSEPLEVDVMDIVQPHPPENVTLALMGTEENPYFLVRWEAPHDADTRSGWVTLTYEIRVKLENGRHEEEKEEGDNEWEMYNAGKQRELSVYSPQPGGHYIVQVRCRLDQGRWSEWGPPAFIHIPDISMGESSVLIFAVTVGIFIFLTVIGILAVKRKHVKRCLLPPVPGPKIKGFDNHILKMEKPEDIFDPLTLQRFPAMPDCGDHIEYVVVMDTVDDGEESTSQTKQECRKSDYWDVDLSAAETLSKQYNAPKDGRKTLVYTGEHEDCGPDSTDGLSEHLKTPDKSDKETDLHQNSLRIKFLKDMVRNSHSICTSRAEKNKYSTDGFEEYVDTNARQELALKTEEGEDYSQVSGIYRDNVLVLQKSTISIQEDKEIKSNDLNKKFTDKSCSTHDVPGTGEYVETMTL